MKKGTTILLLLLNSAYTMLFGQYDPSKVCRFENGRLVFVLDQRWTTLQRNEIRSLYDIDSMVMVAVFAGKRSISDSGETWSAEKLDNYRFRLFKSAEGVTANRAADEMVFLIDDEKALINAVNERESVAYGVNRLTRNTVLQSGEDQIRFFLPGNRQAGKVFLSGSFNGWSTTRTPMVRSDSGWHATLRLQPGKYTYKYIIDGRWTPDPFNKQKEYDHQGGDNSVMFCYNQRFTLKGYPEAAKVYIAGSFNGWRAQELRMIRIRGQWMINLFLREGTHAYKFIVDGQWINDPANPVTRPDGRGNVNSFISKGDTLFFRLSGFPKAEKIAVAGDFNGWNSGELFMTRTSGGWVLPYVLASGVYQYKFVVDGRWIIDPANPNTTGAGDFTNSILTVKPNHTFRLDKFPGAREVFLTGSFNGWSRDGYRMIRTDGAWIFPVFLKPGKHLYKFIVDGKYYLDPGNELWEENEYGTGNSVLWINP